MFAQDNLKEKKRMKTLVLKNISKLNPIAIYPICMQMLLINNTSDDYQKGSL